jgi:hypothetical protein
MQAPQLFHGIGREVTVEESPSARDSSTGACPLRWNSRLNTRSGGTTPNDAIGCHHIGVPVDP